YKQNIRRKFEKATQGNRKVSEYIHYLEEQYNLLGSLTESDLVNRFWNGAADYLQRGLWRNGLHPDSSTWDQVVSQAEIIEISENVGQYNRDRPWHSTSHNRETRSQDKRRDYFGSWHEDKTASDKQDSSYTMNTSYEDKDRKSNNGESRSRSHTYIQKIELKNKQPEKDDADRIAIGRCFRCNEPGHLSRNCPQGSSVKNSGNKPPGISAYHLQPTTEDNANTDSSDEFIEVLDISPRPMPSSSFLLPSSTPLLSSFSLSTPNAIVVIPFTIVNNISAFFPYSQLRFCCPCLCLPSYPVHNIFGICQIKPRTSRSSSY
ncbi:hypothetical protein CVT25_009733, partial [Psilocybe cyanescens]